MDAQMTELERERDCVCVCVHVFVCVMRERERERERDSLNARAHISLSVRWSSGRTDDRASPASMAMMLLWNIDGSNLTGVENVVVCSQNHVLHTTKVYWCRMLSKNAAGQ